MNCVRCYVNDGRDEPATYIIRGESCCEAHMRHYTRTENRFKALPREDLPKI
jgi:hypothetical protein